MAKAPKPSMVMTRLKENLPFSALTALHRCVVEADQDELARLLGNTLLVVAQKGEGLAPRLTSVFQHSTVADGQQVIAFNNDRPHLAPSVLDNAFETLATHDVVVEPTHDGGYYLVGAKAPHESLRTLRD